MKSIYLAIISTILLPLAHLPFESSDAQWYVLTMSDRVVAFLWCIAFFVHSPKENINLRSIIALSAIFTGLRVCYYAAWLNTGINDLFVYPSSLILSVFFFFKTSLRQYDHKSDLISNDNVMLCFWRPWNGVSIVHSLAGAAIGSVAIYYNGILYGYRWGQNKYQAVKYYDEEIYRKFVTIDTGVKMTPEIKSCIEGAIGESAGCFNIKFLRFKCVFAIRHVLAELGSQFKPSFFEFIPSLYALKIFKIRLKRPINDR